MDGATDDDNEEELLPRISLSVMLQPFRTPQLRLAMHQKLHQALD